MLFLKRRGYHGIALGAVDASVRACCAGVLRQGCAREGDVTIGTGNRALRLFVVRQESGGGHRIALGTLDAPMHALLHLMGLQQRGGGAHTTCSASNRTVRTLLLVLHLGSKTNRLPARASVHEVQYVSPVPVGRHGVASLRAHRTWIASCGDLLEASRAKRVPAGVRDSVSGDKEADGAE